MRWSSGSGCASTFLEEGCGAALFVGLHAMAGAADGVMDHTVSGQSWRNPRFDGTLVGETGIDAALCGTWGCAVLLVTGGEATCREAKELLGPGLTTVPVEPGLRRCRARQLALRRVRPPIEEGARRALRDLAPVAPYDPGRPCEIRVELYATHAADACLREPGVEVVDSRRVVCRADDWWTAWQRFSF